VPAPSGSVGPAKGAIESVDPRSSKPAMGVIRELIKKERKEGGQLVLKMFPKKGTYKK